MTQPSGKYFIEGIFFTQLGLYSLPNFVTYVKIKGQITAQLTRCLVAAAKLTEMEASRLSSSQI